MLRKFQIPRANWEQVTAEFPLEGLSFHSWTQVIVRNILLEQWRDVG